MTQIPWGPVIFAIFGANLKIESPEPGFKPRAFASSMVAACSSMTIRPCSSSIEEPKERLGDAFGGVHATMTTSENSAVIRINHLGFGGGLTNEANRPRLHRGAERSRGSEKLRESE